MSAKSRNKGKRGELEVVGLFREHGFPGAHRTAPMQAGAEGYQDIGGIDPFLCEARLHARPRVLEWTREVLDLATSPGFIRVLAWREHRLQWRGTVNLEELAKLGRELNAKRGLLLELKAALAEANADIARLRALLADALKAESENKAAGLTAGASEGVPATSGHPAGDLAPGEAPRAPDGAS